ncbi:uncharacterized protein LOC122259243 [Penaeus japonicus]|uniref:uncharacterized protein LOC122259243 n=1 Tax=Penaeus japonicus TaxID=27405 RepID=UPI001C7148AB|nr:uncharacterized protein LOC122259243 [Penaeus japonicus]
MCVFVLLINEERVKTVVDVWEPPCIPAHRLDPRQDVDAVLDTNINCFDRIVLHCFLKLCGCSLYGMTLRDAPICTLNETNSCYSTVFIELSRFMKTNAFEKSSSKAEDADFLADTRRCIEEIHNQCHDKRVCRHYQYDYTVTTSPIEPSLLDVLRQDMNDNTSRIAAVTIYFSSLDYTLIQLYRMNYDELISTLGGYMGLCLGSSFITWIEFFIYNVTLNYALFKILMKKVMCRSEVAPTVMVKPADGVKGDVMRVGW